MRLLANENFPGDAVAALVAAGHEVIWVRKEAPGMKDPEVLAWAMREDRILLTFDKDFGELAWRSGLPATCGIILFRLPMPRPGVVAAALAARLAERADWAGNFAVIEPGRVRIRALPPRSVRTPSLLRSEYGRRRGRWVTRGSAARHNYSAWPR